ncbi:NAD-dependent epimerase/dehydratase family protein [Sphingobium yanoikuyae]|jgi:nucleoside-diphosphate-sugar epimerase|uniref:NAD-dependent epimerase/dehydratase family protein n=1 Tax=Sphingobium yanoikuyae TaxID=13690 RepID=UPI003F10D415
MRALLVGGAGFIGSHLARRLFAEGWEVHVLLRPDSDGWRLATLPDVTQHRLALSHGPALQACIADSAPTHIFWLVGNTAWRHDGAVTQAGASVETLAGFLALLEAVARTGRPPQMVVRTGSIAEYGAQAVPFREDQRERPLTAYAASLTAATYYAQALARNLPFPIVTARLALVYGPGQAADFLVPALIGACIAGRPIILSRPTDRRDLIHVGDAVDALLCIAESNVRGGTILNVGSGTDVAVGDLADRVVGLTGANPRLVRRETIDDPVTLRLAVEALAMNLGWRARIMLDDGLERTISAVRASKAVQA